MKKIFMLLVFVSTACGDNYPPANLPTKGSDGNPYTCQDALKHMQTIGCPHTGDPLDWVLTCQRIKSSKYVPCMVSAPTCGDASNCDKTN